MLPEVDFDDIRDLAIALLIWAAGGWILWELRGWAIALPGTVGPLLTGAINIIGLFYIFTLVPLKNLVGAYFSGGSGKGNA